MVLEIFLLIILPVVMYLVTVFLLIAFSKVENYTRLDSIIILILTFMFCLAMIIDFNGLNKENLEDFNESKCYCEW